MTLKGHVENGAVVLDEPMDLPDGTVVEVEPTVSFSQQEQTNGTHPRVPTGGLGTKPKSLVELLENCAFHTGIADLSERHNELRFSDLHLEPK